MSAPKHSNKQFANLLERFSALEKVVIAHDQWAKDYNVTVEARNAKIVSDHEHKTQEHKEWQRKQVEAIVAAMAAFDRMEKMLRWLVEHSWDRVKDSAIKGFLKSLDAEREK